MAAASRRDEQRERRRAERALCEGVKHEASDERPGEPAFEPERRSSR